MDCRIVTINLMSMETNMVTVEWMTMGIIFSVALSKMQLICMYNCSSQDNLRLNSLRGC